MRNVLVGLLVTLAVAATASAAASLDLSYEYLGNGLFGIDFYLQTDQPPGAAYVNVSFWADTGTINQLFGTAVNDEATAQTFLGADAPKDTWAYLPFGANSAPGYSYVGGVQGASVSGFAQTATSWTMACGSGTETPVSNGSLVAHVAADVGVSWAGVVSIDQDYGLMPSESVPYDVSLNQSYEVGPGETIELNSQIFHLYNSAPTVAWDLDGDLPGGSSDFETPGIFTAEYLSVGTGSLEISYEELLSLGMEAGNAYTIGMRAIHPYGLTETTAYTTLTLVPEPATLALLGLGVAAVIRRRRA